MVPSQYYVYDFSSATHSNKNSQMESLRPLCLNTSACIENQDVSVVGDMTPPLEQEFNVYSAISDLRCKNVNKIVIAHLNIYSIRNKFEMLKDMVSGNIDILLQPSRGRRYQPSRSRM